MRAGRGGSGLGGVRRNMPDVLALFWDERSPNPLFTPVVGHRKQPSPSPIYLAPISWDALAASSWHEQSASLE